MKGYVWTTKSAGVLVLAWFGELYILRLVGRKRLGLWILLWHQKSFLSVRGILNGKMAS